MCGWYKEKERREKREKSTSQERSMSIKYISKGRVGGLMKKWFRGITLLPIYISLLFVIDHKMTCLIAPSSTSIIATCSLIQYKCVSRSTALACSYHSYRLHGGLTWWNTSKPKILFLDLLLRGPSFLWLVLNIKTIASVVRRSVISKLVMITMRRIGLGSYDQFN